jgi:NTP pyrophosphatase (non-canonical NTP hydrolase)
MKYKTEGINQLSKQINEFVKSIGFDNADVPLRMALIHSEISEAFEAFRKDKMFKLNESQKNVLMGWRDDSVFKEYFEGKCKDTFEDEIADSIIRLLDLCGKMDIDIEYHIDQKMRYNATRGFKYGGKKF